MDTCDQGPLRLPKMQDHQLLTVHWRSLSGWGRERLSTCLLYNGCQYIRKWQCSDILDILQLAVGFLNATINWKTWNTGLEIGPDGSSQTQRDTPVARFGAVFGPPRSSRLCVWTVLEPNRSVVPVQTRIAGGLPGPVANTTYGTIHSALEIYWYICCPELHPCRFKQLISDLKWWLINISFFDLEKIICPSHFQLCVYSLVFHNMQSLSY